MPPIPLEFVLTATDEFFFFGTRSAFDTIMGGDTLAANADFGKSSQYFLDSATSVWYTNSDGFVISTIVPLALMGPAIDNVFDNIIEELGSEPPQDEPSSAPMPLGPQTELIMEGLNAYDELLTGATISTSIDEGGIVRFRATMSVNP